MDRIPSIPPLPADLAAAADEIIDGVIATAAREVTATGHQLGVALTNAWAHVARDSEDVWALCVLRLKETGNEEMLRAACPERRQ